MAAVGIGDVLDAVRKIPWHHIMWVTLFSPVFTALHVMQTRYCDEISVRLSVRLSVCQRRDL